MSLCEEAKKTTPQKGSVNLFALLEKINGQVFDNLHCMCDVFSEIKEMS